MKYFKRNRESIATALFLRYNMIYYARNYVAPELMNREKRYKNG